jgi:Cu2+-exporting ATPase
VVESAAARIQRRVQEGLAARPPSVRLAEHAARVFVPVVLGVAGLTAAWWLHVDPQRWIHAVVAVLMVTCPCALALAAPVARTLAAAGFARSGVLPLRMDRVEELARAGVLACDKTGTLTLGRPELRKVVPLRGDVGEAAWRAAAAALARRSRHPLARPLVVASAGAGRVGMVREHPGAGMSGEVAGRRWRLGRPEFVLAGTGGSDPGLAEALRALQADGRSLVLLGEERAGGAVVAFVLEDRPRPGLDAWLAGVRGQGVGHVALLSGDHPAAVARFAHGRAFDEARGGMRPDDKLAWIRRRQAAGARVWMLGDGLNDVPVLAAADVSVSFATAADAAQARSDFVVIGESLAPLAGARRLARRTRRIVLQNLLWAAAYNLTAVPLAAAGWVPPWAAALGMAASSLLVVGNALRLRERPVPRLAGSAPVKRVLGPQPSRT